MITCVAVTVIQIVCSGLPAERPSPEQAAKTLTQNVKPVVPSVPSLPPSRVATPVYAPNPYWPFDRPMERLPERPVVEIYRPDPYGLYPWFPNVVHIKKDGTVCYPQFFGC